jgi:hypothetical protein
MSACQKINDIGDAQDELTRLLGLLSIVYASATSQDRDLSEIRDGLLWVVGDIEDDVKRIIVGIQKIEKART